MSVHVVDSNEEEQREIDGLVEEAKWNMYGEEWGVAVQTLEKAKNLAIAIKDKTRIDNILELLHKAHSQQKVEIT
jgi:deoxyinosine 3'endonuclease (endonuclease V)